MLADLQAGQGSAGKLLKDPRSSTTPIKPWLRSAAWWPMQRGQRHGRAALMKDGSFANSWTTLVAQVQHDDGQDQFRAGHAGTVGD